MVQGDPSAGGQGGERDGGQGGGRAGGGGQAGAGGQDGGGLDVAAMIERFRLRARAVRDRAMPPVEGPERRRIMVQAQQDYMDFAMLGDAEGSLDDGILTLRVDLRPREEPEV